MKPSLRQASVFVTAALVASLASAQQIANTGFKSVGRGWPLAADLRDYEVTGPAIPIVFAELSIQRNPCVRRRRSFETLRCQQRQYLNSPHTPTIRTTKTNGFT